MTAKRYSPQGVHLAVDPSAIGIEFFPRKELDLTSFERFGDVAAVRIQGPIAYSGCELDTYAAIESRFDCALASKPSAVVLRIASPGGEVSGAFDCMRNMKRKAAEAGVKLIAHSDDKACSAAYILALAASEIYCTDTATIGSIGVIHQLAEQSVADAAMGLKFTTLTSGARKADGNIHERLTEAGARALQESVNVMAGVFFEQVGVSRPELGAIGAQALEAGVRVGKSAVDSKLADGVRTFSELIKELTQPKLEVSGGQNSTDAISASAPTGIMSEEDKDTDKKDALRASLAKASEDSDPKKAARAKAALAAYDSDEDDDKDKKKKDEEAKAASAAAAAAQSATLASLSAQVATLSADLAASKAAAETSAKNALFASRSDLPAAAIDAVRGLPFETAKAVLASIPVVVNPLAPPSIGAVTGAPGVLPVGGIGGVTAAELAHMDLQMGVPTVKPKPGAVTVVGAVQSFGVATPGSAN